jgi:hypothetical protein
MFKLSLAQKLNILFGVIMVLIYFTMGIAVLSINAILQSWDVTYKMLFGILILIYAIYRIYKVYTYYSEAKVNNSGIEDDEKI